MNKIILASHGEMSKGLLNSARMIVGDLAKDIITYSLYPGESPNDFYEQLAKSVKDHSDQQYIIVCDIKGGSVHTTLSKLIIYQNVVILSGMNLNMVLDLVLTYHNHLDSIDYEKVTQSAKAGITLLSNHLNECEDEDF